MRMREEKHGVVMRVRVVYHGAVRMRRETRGCDEGESSVPRGCESDRISNVFSEDAGRVYERRVRRPPSYLSDYITTDELTEDEAYMVQNVSTGDPLYFEEAVKEEKWRQVMDSEISSIEKNKTWSLSELSTGAKKLASNGYTRPNTMNMERLTSTKHV
jgi:hypothetical protein